MKAKTSLISIFLLVALQASAFTYVSPDTFTPWYQKLAQKIVVCKWHISCYRDQKSIGAFTQLNSTDKQTSFPTTYNNNLAITMEVGTTSVASITTLSNLSSIGTITTGVWNGSPVQIAYGGTATTTGIQTYGVVLGNGNYGLTVASTTGTSGQFLTSNGAGAYPTWQTAPVNQTVDYNFTSTYFGVKNLYASSTVANPIYLNKVSYAFPTDQGASTTALSNTGSGTLAWLGRSPLLASPDDKFVTSINTTGASTTLTSTTIPANSLRIGDVIRLTAFATTTDATNNSGYTVNFNVSLGGTATSTCGAGIVGGTGANYITATSTFTFTIKVQADSHQTITCYSSTGSNKTVNTRNSPGSGGSGVDYSSMNSYLDLTSAQTLYFEGFVGNTVGASETHTGSFYGVLVEMLNR